MSETHTEEVLGVDDREASSEWAVLGNEVSVANIVSLGSLDDFLITGQVLLSARVLYLPTRGQVHGVSG
jgi:hypothetical protein